ncbi:MAG TPA: porin family protein [Sphingomonas sp.]|nr:porin family protein [Sphingomonas sp.]
MKNLILATLAASALATPALAQDAAAFTGFKVEGLVGYDKLKGKGESRDGVAYGVGVGYDHQFGRVVAGLEGEWMDSNTDGCRSNFLTATDTICARAKRDLYVGGRIGTPVTPSTLLYAKAGYTNARVETSYTDTAAPANNVTGRDNLNGVRVGAGVEQKFGPNLYAKAEYRYSNYEQGVSRHQVLGGIGFRF